MTDIQEIEAEIIKESNPLTDKFAKYEAAKTKFVQLRERLMTDVMKMEITEGVDFYERLHKKIKKLTVSQPFKRIASSVVTGECLKQIHNECVEQNVFEEDEYEKKHSQKIQHPNQPSNVQAVKQENQSKFRSDVPSLDADKVQIPQQSNEINPSEESNKWNDATDQSALLNNGQKMTQNQESLNQSNEVTVDMLETTTSMPQEMMKAQVNETQPQVQIENPQQNQSQSVPQNETTQENENIITVETPKKEQIEQVKVEQVKVEQMEKNEQVKKEQQKGDKIENQNITGQGEKKKKKKKKRNKNKNKDGNQQQENGDDKDDEKDDQKQ